MALRIIGIVLFLFLASVVSGQNHQNETQIRRVRTKTPLQNKITTDLEEIKSNLGQIILKIEKQAEEIENVKSNLNEIKSNIGNVESRSEEAETGFDSVQQTSTTGMVNTSVEIQGESLKRSINRQFAYLIGMNQTILEVLEHLSQSLKEHDQRLKIHEMLLQNTQHPFVSSVGQGSNQHPFISKDTHESEMRPRDCSDIRALGFNENRVYRIYPGNVANGVEADVYCEMDPSSSDSWLVFQRRKDGSVNFEKTWDEYATGFGSLDGEFWLGNDLLHILTSSGNYKLRIDLEDFELNRRYAEYTNFYVASSVENYRLNVSRGYSGNAGDSFSQHGGKNFTTKDVDNDSSKGNCAQMFRGGWWFGNCHACNLNGRYLRGVHKSYADGVNWKDWRGVYYSLKTTEMKIARLS